MSHPAGMRPIRVLAADDSAVMRGVLKTVFDLHAREHDLALPPMELIGAVRDGAEALDAVASLRPDVLLLDLEMPKLNGLAVLERLRVQMPALPVIMCSAYTERGARSTLDALAAGAKDYVMKPGQQRDFAAALDTLMSQLLPKIAALAAGSTRVRAAAVQPQPAAVRECALPRDAAPLLRDPVPLLAGAPMVELVVVGVSTGGPSALETMLPALPADFPVPLLIVQHMPRLFTGALAERLSRMCALPVSEGRQGDALQPGTIVLAPGGVHMEVAGHGGGSRAGSLRLHERAPVNHCRPSVDHLFHSAARTFGGSTLALVLTGMGQDGLEGARAIREAGGVVLAQDEASSAVWGMPGRVVQEGVAHAQVPLAGLAGAVLQRVRMGRGARATMVPGEGAQGGRTQREAAHGMF